MICINCHQEVDKYESGNTCFNCMQPEYARRAIFAIKIMPEEIHEGNQISQPS